MALDRIKFNIASFNDADAGGNNYYAGIIYEVFNSNDTLADIYSDAAGANPINQDGISNKSSAIGEVVFYIDSGDYYIKVNEKVEYFSTLLSSEALINNLSLPYVFDTVSLYKDSTIVFPVGKTIHVNDRGADFTVISGTGAGNGANIIGSDEVSQSIQLNLVNGKVTSTGFGSTSDPFTTDNLQSFIDYVGDNQIEGVIDGTSAFNTDILMHRNCNITGLKGTSFASSLVPYGSARIKFDGTLETGGFVFHASLSDITINGLQSTIASTNMITMFNAFSCQLNNIRIENINTDTENNLVWIKQCNDITINNPVLFGTNNSFGSGILIDDDSTVKIYNPDCETINKAITVQGNSKTIVDIFTPYIERCIVGYEHVSGKINTYGGRIINPSTSAVSGRLKSSDFNNFGTIADITNGGSGWNLTAASGQKENVNFYGIDPDSILTGSQIVNMNNSYQGNSVNGATFVHKKNLSDGVNTEFFNIDANSVADVLMCEMEVFAGSQGFGRSLKKYSFLISKEGSNANVTTVTEVYDSSINSSGNWSILLTGTASASSSSVSVGATLDLTGSLNNGGTEDCYMSIKVLGDASFGITKAI